MVKNSIYRWLNLSFGYKWPIYRCFTVLNSMVDLSSHHPPGRYGYPTPGSPHADAHPRRPSRRAPPPGLPPALVFMGKKKRPKEMGFIWVLYGFYMGFVWVLYGFMWYMMVQGIPPFYRILNFPTFLRSSMDFEDFLGNVQWFLDDFPHEEW